VRGSELRAAWERFWHRPESARNLAVARVLLAGTALWVVLSRAALPEVAALPGELFLRVSPERRLRFLMVLGPGVEKALFAALHVTLLGALLGVLPRLSCLASSVLLYHFAPFETIIRSPNPYLRGLTIPTLGLAILAAAPCADVLRLRWGRRDPAPPAAPRYRWALALVQVVFCQVYLFAGYAKLVTSGLSWTAPENMRGYLLLLNQGLTGAPEATFGYTLAQVPSAITALALAGLVFELSFPLVLVSRVARWILLPLAVLFHLGNSVLFRIAFQNLPLLLMFVDWGGGERAPAS
jgi:hypothetical protein